MIHWRASAKAVNMRGADRSLNFVHKYLPLSLNTQGVTVLWVDRDYTLNIHFCRKCTTTDVQDSVNDFGPSLYRKCCTCLSICHYSHWHSWGTTSLQ